jgi:hypothetical protein
MKQLPWKSPPKWLTKPGQVIAGVVFVALTVSLLPALLLISLVTALLLIPVLRQVRKEAGKSCIDLNAPAREQIIDVTPLHQKVQRNFCVLQGRRR